MEAWWTRYLPDVQVKDVLAALQAGGMAATEAEQGTQWVLGHAALCRLAFSSFGTPSGDTPMSWSAPEQAIISQTQPRMGRGRPQTAQWAFWTAWFAREERTAAGTPLAHSVLAQLIGALLGRHVPTRELMTQLGRLRKAARNHASAAAAALLKNTLKEDMKQQEFERWLRGYLGEDLEPTSQNPPRVVDGKLSDEWLRSLLKIRGELLRLVRKFGPLGGHEPVLSLRSINAIVRGLPLGGSNRAAGTIHLGKAVDVLAPATPTIEKQSVSLTFPVTLLNGEPCAAALCAVPAWWQEWERAFVGFGGKTRAPNQSTIDLHTGRKRKLVRKRKPRKGE